MSGYRLLLDSSAWLSYFLAADEKVKEVVDSEENTLFTSVITLHEVKKKLIREKHTDAQITKALGFIKENSIVLQVDDDIAEQSVKYCIKDGMHTIDALIYESGRKNNCIVMTGDHDFKGLENVEIIGENL